MLVWCTCGVQSFFNIPDHGWTFDGVSSLDTEEPNSGLIRSCHLIVMGVVSFLLGGSTAFIIVLRFRPIVERNIASNDVIVTDLLLSYKDCDKKNCVNACLNRRGGPSVCNDFTRVPTRVLTSECNDESHLPLDKCGNEPEVHRSFIDVRQYFHNPSIY